MTTGFSINVGGMARFYAVPMRRLNRAGRLASRPLPEALQHLVETANDDGTRGPDHVGNGDWLNLGGGASKEVIATTHYAYVFRIMAEMAEAAEYFKSKG